MPACAVRWLLMLLLACSTLQGPAEARAAAGGALDEPALQATEDVAAISLRYRQQLAEQIESFSLVTPGLEAAPLLPPFQPPPAVLQDDGLRATLDTCTRYELMSLLR